MRGSGVLTWWDKRQDRKRLEANARSEIRMREAAESVNRADQMRREREARTKEDTDRYLKKYENRGPIEPGSD
jgi:hypothetical protein